jgi:hypothetical protein
MQKTKKEDFRMEEELRAQKAKYEETSEDVFRRMQDIKEAEVDLVQDLTSFLEAELSYYDRCREVLLNVKREWPVRWVNHHREMCHVLTWRQGDVISYPPLAIAFQHCPRIRRPLQSRRRGARARGAANDHPKAVQDAHPLSRPRGLTP